jgi:hypothetical protein
MQESLENSAAGLVHRDKLHLVLCISDAAPSHCGAQPATLALHLLMDYVHMLPAKMRSLAMLCGDSCS